MTSPTTRALACLGLALAACAPRLVPGAAVPPPEERARAQRELGAQRRYLACTAQAVPLPGRPDVLLVGERAPAVAEGTAPRLLPPGTPVRIDRLEFPTRADLDRRPAEAGALRRRPWAWLSSPGEPGPLVVALPASADTADAVRAELGRLLTAEDPAPRLAALAEGQRSAVLRQALVAGMDAATVELAWGAPVRRVSDRSATGQASDAWSWDDGRGAWFAEGRLVRWEGAALPR